MNHDDHENTRLLSLIVRLLIAVHKKLDIDQEDVMSKFNDVQDAVARVKAGTDKLAAWAKSLQDQINNTAGDGLDGPQTEQVLAALASLQANLEATGTDPNNPIPSPLSAPVVTP